LLIAFTCGCILTGLVIGGQRPRTIGDIDSRYAVEHGRAAEIIGRLEDELGRERELNRELRKHNLRARELTEGIANSAERNVRNLQDAVSLISEIRKKVQVLEKFYSDSDPGGSVN
jgi:hypothetical protein